MPILAAHAGGEASASTMVDHVPAAERCLSPLRLVETAPVIRVPPEPPAVEEPACHPESPAASPLPAKLNGEQRPQVGEAPHEAPVTGRLRLPASEHDCQITDLSEVEMIVWAPDAITVEGEQVAVVTQGLPRLFGVVCWKQGEVMRVHFARPIPAEVLAKAAQIRRRVRSPRCARAKVELAGSVCFEGTKHEVIVGNISAGGMMMTARVPVRRGQRKLIRDGQALMIHLPELLPFGGHVRWTCGAQCGVMFSKLLTLPMAEEIMRMADLSSAWMDDVLLAHQDFGG